MQGNMTFRCFMIFVVFYNNLSYKIKEKVV